MELPKSCHDDIGETSGLLRGMPGVFLYRDLNGNPKTGNPKNMVGV